MSQNPSDLNWAVLSLGTLHRLGAHSAYPLSPALLRNNNILRKHKFELNIMERHYIANSLSTEPQIPVQSG